jgi:prevent-host-death family protein
MQRCFEMMIKSATTLRNDYDNVVTQSKQKQEPVFVTRNGEGEMVFLPLELWEKREAELTMLNMLLQREQSRIAGAKTFSMEEMRQLTEAELHED